MSETVTIKSCEQALAVAAQLIGFQPCDSVVILGTGGGPTARVDAGPIDALCEALSPALRHWSDRVVLVLGYGAGQEVAADIARWLLESGVQVADLIRVDNGEGIGLRSDSSLDAVNVRASRAEIEAEAARVTDPREAESMALSAYEAGRGAHAWAFLDRAHELRGYTSVAMAALSAAIQGAVKPTSL